MRAPRPVARLVLFLAGLLLIVLALGFWWANWQDTRREETCRRGVAIRDDNRAMWLYVIELNPDSPQRPQFVAELDRRLPRLECSVDGDLVPLLPEDRH